MNGDTHTAARSQAAMARAIFATIASVGLALASSSCNRTRRPPPPENMTPLRIQLNWVAEPEFGGIYAARESGAFAQRKLLVDIAAGGAGTPVVQMVATGKSDFGVAGADDVEIARARGIDVVAIFSTFQHSPQGVMVHASRKLNDLSELHNGTLALEPGLPFGAYLRKKFSFDGVTIIPYDGGISKFVMDREHSQQCYATSEPIAAKAAGSDPQIFTATQIGFDPYTNVIITRSSVLRERLPVARLFIEAIIDGWRHYLASPRETDEMIAKLNIAMSPASLEAGATAQRGFIMTDETAAHGLGTMTADRWAKLGAQLVDLGIIETAPQANDCFTLDVLPGAP